MAEKVPMTSADVYSWMHSEWNKKVEEHQQRQSLLIRRFEQTYLNHPKHLGKKEVMHWELFNNLSLP